MGLTGMTTSLISKRERALLRLLGRLQTMKEKGRAVNQNFSRWRLIIFLTGGAVCLMLYQQAWFHTGNSAFALFLAGFLIVSYRHQQLKSRLQRLAGWEKLKAANLARLRLDWPHIPEVIHPPPSGHPYASDLDLTGPHSLLALIDTTFSSNGRDRLHTWVLHPPHPGTDSWDWPQRQALIKELRPLSLVRDRCVLASRLISPEPINGTRIASLLERSVGIPSLPKIVPLAFLLTGATWTLGLWTLLTGVPNYWLVPLALYVGLYFYHAGTIHALFGRVLSLHVELEKLVQVLAVVERHRFPGCPTVRRICAAFLSDKDRPSRTLKQIGRICQGLSIKAHPLVHLILNVMLPWDLWFTRKLDRTLNRVRHRLPEWLDGLGLFDAAGAIAGFAYLNPDYVWPTLVQPGSSPSEPLLSGHALGHPLIPHDRRVTNDLDLKGAGRVILITGSNMSGKSTFLRTLGINLCLAQAGGPVCAQAFAWTWLRLYCCIRVTDALDEGLSYFYAEVKRLKVILDAVQDTDPVPVLFLIDEIYRGTNNRERLAGSEAYVKALQRSRGFGLLSTHDLELTRLADANGHIRNAHFQETIKEGALHFDYRLRPGPCPTTNALRIMAQEGLPVPEIDQKPEA